MIIEGMNAVLMTTVGMTTVRTTAEALFTAEPPRTRDTEYRP